MSNAKKYFTRSAPRNNEQATQSNNPLTTSQKTSAVKMREKKNTGKFRNRPLSAFLSSSISKSSSVVFDNPSNAENDWTEQQFERANHRLETIERDSTKTQPNSDKKKKVQRAQSSSATAVSMKTSNQFDSEDSDGDQQVPTKRLQRSKIIASFLEQLDSNKDSDDDDFGDDEDNTDSNEGNSLQNNNNDKNDSRNEQNQLKQQQQ